MKTFEERYTAWIDGKLHGADLEAFERELKTHPGAETDRTEAEQLGQLLRAHSIAPQLRNTDFFNLQIMEKIAAEERRPAAAAPTARWSFATLLPHLAWGGVCCLLVSALVFRGWVAPSQEALSGSSLVAQRPLVAPRGAEISPAVYQDSMVEARAVEPGVSATPVRTSKDGVTVLWLDGLDYLPATYNLQ